jgi:hypothetical protein
MILVLDVDSESIYYGYTTNPEVYASSTEDLLVILRS